jgi:hypothetical protein
MKFQGWKPSTREAFASCYPTVLNNGYSTQLDIILFGNKSNPVNLEPIIVIHAASGGTALALGLIGMISRKRRGLHTVNGILFHVAALVTCVTASVISFQSWDTHWWLFLIALFSYIAVALGHVSARVRWQGWIPFHIICQCSAYISMTTAFLVVNRSILPKFVGIPSYWSWIIPTVIGTPLIVLATARYSPKKSTKPKTLDADA